MSFRIKHSPRFQREDPIDPPLTRHAYDDEFELGSLDPAWTRAGTFDDISALDPAASFASGGCRTSFSKSSWLRFQPAADQPNSAIQISKPITFPTDCFVWVRASFSFRNSAQTNDDASVAFGIFDTLSLLNGVYMYMNESNANTVKLEAWKLTAGVGAAQGATDNVGGAGLSKGQVIHSVGIQKLGTTYHYWALNASGNWLWIATTTHVTTMGTIVLFCGNASSASPGNAVIGYDFFRFKTGMYLP